MGEDTEAAGKTEMRDTHVAFQRAFVTLYGNDRVAYLQLHRFYDSSQTHISATSLHFPA